MSIKKILLWIVMPVVIVGIIIFLTFGITFTTTERDFYKNYDVLIDMRDCISCPFNHGLIKTTKQQYEKIALLEKSFFKEDRILVNQLRAEKNTLLDLLLQSVPDTLAISKKLNEISILQFNLEAKRVKHLLEEKNVLTTDQQKKFERHFIKPAVCPWMYR